MKVQNQLLQEVSKHLNALTNKSKLNNDLFKHARIADVKEFKFTLENKDTKALVVFLPYAYFMGNKNQVKKIANYLTEKRKQHTFVLAKRTVVHKRSDYK